MTLVVKKPSVLVSTELQAPAHSSTTPFKRVGDVDLSCGAGGCRRIGVYLSGIMHTLDRTACSIREKVLEPLKRQGHLLYLFAVIEDDETAPYYKLLDIPDGLFEEKHVQIVERPSVEEKCAQDCVDHLHRPTLESYGWLDYCRYRLSIDLFKQMVISPPSCAVQTAFALVLWNSCPP